MREDYEYELANIFFSTKFGILLGMYMYCHGDQEMLFAEKTE